MGRGRKQNRARATSIDTIPAKPLLALKRRSANAVSGQCA